MGLIDPHGDLAVARILSRFPASYTAAHGSSARSYLGLTVVRIRNFSRPKFDPLPGYPQGDVTVRVTFMVR